MELGALAEVEQQLRYDQTAEVVPYELVRKAGCFWGVLLMHSQQGCCCKTEVGIPPNRGLNRVD